MKLAGLQWMFVGICLNLLMGLVPLVNAADQGTRAPVVLEPVTVIGQPEEAEKEDSLSGKTTLTEQQLKVLPKGNGSLNELLNVMPSVQTSDMTNTSLQGGEIAPPDISISGGKIYENNFMVDGVGVNNLGDPMSDFSPNNGLFLPGRPQSLFVDSSLIDEVTIYDHNVSAEFSGFTGGVVDARTLSPSSTFGGHVRYKTTRDQWTEVHVDDEQKKEFEESNNVTMQPKFDKHDAAVLLNIPLTEKMGILSSYSILDSRIELTHLNEAKDLSRQRKNLFLKYAIDITNQDVFSLTFNSQPEREDYFYSDAYESDYTIERKTNALHGDYRHFGAAGEFEFKAGYLQSDRERNAPQHLFLWKVSSSKPWGALVDSSTSREGMVGSLAETEQTFQLKPKFTFEPINTGSLRHKIKVGADYERVRGSRERDEESYQYYSPVASASVDCPDGAIDCIDNEQYFTRRSVYQAASVVTAIDKYNAFVEDSMRWKRLEWRPGINVSYDDFMGNTNYSPRLAGSYDIFGNKFSVLVAGLNRYYGKTLLAFKLREAGKPTLIQKWNAVASAWEPLSYGTSYKYSELKTPYTDELVVGLDQRIFSGTAKLRYVIRNGEDEFARQLDADAREDGIKYYTLNNNGATQHEEYRIEWSRGFNRHYVSANVTYQETDTSNENYNYNFDDSDVAELCWFDGETLPCAELPRQDYNRPWVANFIYSVKLPWNLTFTNVTKYRSGYLGLDTLNKTERTAEGVPEEVTLAYQEEKQPESWIFNWKLDWRRNLYRNHGIQLSLEINNLFDQKVASGTETEIQTYEMGRQFWAGMEYYF